MCQWSLLIQLLEFHNPMNTETKVGDNDQILYCCCDKGGTCEPNLSLHMKANNCTNLCDIFFLLSLSDESSKLQSISTIDGTIKNSPPHSLYGYTFSFALVSVPNLVRHTHTHYKTFAF